jgi:hypothetical protein
MVSNNCSALSRMRMINGCPTWPVDVLPPLAPNCRHCLAERYETMQPLRTDKKPFDQKVKSENATTWLIPKLVDEVKFIGLGTDKRALVSSKCFLTLVRGWCRALGGSSWRSPTPSPISTNSNQKEFRRSSQESARYLRDACGRAPDISNGAESETSIRSPCKNISRSPSGADFYRRPLVRFGIDQVPSL